MILEWRGEYEAERERGERAQRQRARVYRVLAPILLMALLVAIAVLSSPTQDTDRRSMVPQGLASASGAGPPRSRSRARDAIAAGRTAATPGAEDALRYALAVPARRRHRQAR